MGILAPHPTQRELPLSSWTGFSSSTQRLWLTGGLVELGGRFGVGGVGWVPAYNAQGPDALTFRRTGGRRPFFAHVARPTSARRSAPLSARPPRRPEPG